MHKKCTPIYLDNAATTAIDPLVRRAMRPFDTTNYGNASSTQHRFGRDAELATDVARDQVASLLGAAPHEIVFTSGATEANNLAVKGAARAVRDRTGRNHIVTAATEHKCVLGSALSLQPEGFDVTVVPVDEHGVVDLDQLADAVTPQTAIVSIMSANNEVGTIAPIREVVQIAHAAGAVVHTDAAQAVGKLPTNVAVLGVDLLTLSAHKLHGPKGVGAVIIRNSVPIEPLFHGGGQEQGLRSGTVPVPLVVGLGEACRLAEEGMPAEAARLQLLRDRLWRGLAEEIEGIALNGHETERLPGNLNFRVAGVEGPTLLAAVSPPGLAASSQSACSAGGRAVSHVLLAMGQDEATARGAVRLGLGRFTTDAEVALAVEMLVEAARHLKAAPNGHLDTIK